MQFNCNDTFIYSALPSFELFYVHSDNIQSYGSLTFFNYRKTNKNDEVYKYVSSEGNLM